MGFSGCHIAGHSGTANKNRKAFAAIRKHNDSTSSEKKTIRIKVANNKLSPNKKTISKYKQSSLEKVVKYGFQLPLFLIATFVLVKLICYTAVSLNTDLNNASKNVLLLEDQISLDRHAYAIFVKDGKRHMKFEEYKNAQRAFEFALNINPTRIDARVEYTKVLQKRCELENRYCEEAEANYNYLKQLNHVTNDEFN